MRTAEQMELGKEYSEKELKALFECRLTSGIYNVLDDEMGLGNVTMRMEKPNDIMSPRFFTRIK